MKNVISNLALLGIAVLMLGATKSGTVSITPPAVNVPFKPGAGMEVVNANCQTCHSAAYIYTQPALTRAQWTAEVTKMKVAYGAPIADGDVNTIVDYLVAQNGKP
ncbi:MAG: cytochrome c [Candidatus Lustribacter sp.]|jgi:mono/diheme cytochrome c family protein